MTYYAVITNYDSKTERVVGVCVESENFTIVQVIPAMTTKDFARAVMANGYEPLNFSISKEGTVLWECGASTRLTDKSMIVLAEIRNKSNRTMGYRLLNVATRTVGNMRTSDIVSLGANKDIPLLHNGIIRNDTVNCYPLHKYPVMKVDNRGSNKPVNPVKQPAQPVNNRPVKPQPVEPVRNVEEPQVFSKAQQSELMKAKKEIGNMSIIYNSKLSPQQMRVIWVAKKKGVVAEAFAKPEFSVDAMKFYADRLLDNRTVQECEYMLSRPDLTVGQLQELFLCVAEGVHYEDMLDMTESEIQVERNMRSSSFWTFTPTQEGDITESAIQYALKLRGY